MNFIIFRQPNIRSRQTLFLGWFRTKISLPGWHKTSLWEVSYPLDASPSTSYSSSMRFGPMKCTTCLASTSLHSSLSSWWSSFPPRLRSCFAISNCALRWDAIQTHMIAFNYWMEYVNYFTELPLVVAKLSDERIYGLLRFSVWRLLFHHPVGNFRCHVHIPVFRIYFCHRFPRLPALW